MGRQGLRRQRLRGRSLRSRSLRGHSLRHWLRAVPGLRAVPALRAVLGLRAVSALRHLAVPVLRAVSALRYLPIAALGRLPTLARLPRLLPRLLLRPPGLAPRLPARRSHLWVGDTWNPGLTSVGGQHDAFVRGPRSRKLPLVTLSALRHRDSYVWAY
ncbi:hypothetical protein AB0D12_15065 [Streptomyces sp. NPDC048479]|uniref:hypothetical protein n=1 Tax=Streptomyces sp. NPDC048479 TaxID=3154725 RepID=UPI0034379F20